MARVSPFSSLTCLELEPSATGISNAEELSFTNERAIADNTAVVIDVPVDYSTNMKLMEKLGNLLWPI